MRQQRRIERQAQEWDERNRPTSTEHLIGGTQLQEAAAFLQLNRADLSELAQEFITVSRRTQGRLRLRTGMLIPIALITGMAASIVSRFIFPPQLQPAATTEVRPANSASTAPSASPKLSDTEGTQEAPKAATAQTQNEAEIAAEPTQPPLIPVPPNMSAAIANGNYLMVPGGKMPSPSEPGKEVEIWFIQPNADNLPVPIGSAAEREAAPVGR